MRRLSDEVFHELPERLERILNNVEISMSMFKDSFDWKELPKPKIRKAFGVDGSRSIERRSGVVVYAVSSVGIGDRILELHDLSVIEPFKHIEKRVEIHMQTNEARIGIFADGLVILDGALSNVLFLIKKPKTFELYQTEILQNLNDKKLKIVNDFRNELDDWIESLREDVTRGLSQRRTLLSRDKDYDMKILLEFVEFLHSYDRLLEKPIVTIAKNVYESRLSHFFKNMYSVTDQTLVDHLVTKEFGFEKAGYFEFSYEEIGRCDNKIKVLIEELELRNLKRLKVHPCYIRLRDYGNVYLLESNVNLKEVLPIIIGLETDGYIFPLIHAHRYAEIKRREMKAMMVAVMNSLADKPKFRILLKHPRGPLDEF